MSRKRWGKSAAKTEKVVREAVLQPEMKGEISEYLAKAKSVTPYDLANKFGIRLSVARRFLREKEAEGVVIPYIRESKFVVYTTPAELEKRESDSTILVADVLEEVASSAPKASVITDEMDAALVAASSMTTIKPSRLARHRREAGAKKERRDTRPEIVVEPLAEDAKAPPAPEPVAKEPVPKKAPKKTPKKTTKKVEKKEPAPKKVPAKTTKKTETKEPAKKTAKTAPAKEETPKKAGKKPKPTISDISGVGPSLEEKLVEAGFKTVLKLSRAAPDKLAAKVAGVSEAKAQKMITEAQKLLE
ncbi:MAG: helix-hairpin-helix domain-containing protein [Candidatus Thorarchaeota archaeon]